MSPHRAKRPNPKKDKSARRRRPDLAPGRFTTGLLDPAAEARINRLGLNAHSVPPEALLPILLTTTWSGIQAGQEANRCVDACRTLGFALAQLGIVSELRAAEVIVENQRTHQRVRRAVGTPSWDGIELTGHCILTLPDQQRFIDATIEQFGEIAALGMGPAVGRSAATFNPNTGQQVLAPRAPYRQPAGTVLALMRGDLLITYTLSSDTANRVITDHPAVHEHADAHRRAGINLAALVVGHTSCAVS